jgi:hypothetical protein
MFYVQPSSLPLSFRWHYPDQVVWIISGRNSEIIK